MTNRSILIPLLQQAVDIVGSQYALAKSIGVSQQRVWNWLYRDKCGCIPAEYAIPIEISTGGRITRHQLRPDIFREREEQAA